MIKKKSVYIFTALIYLSISFFPVKIYGKESGAKTEVKARLPEKTFIRIFGYTAPSSIVQVLGIRVFAQTSSDKTGYFQFNAVPISFEAKEICLATIDAEKRVGFPLCIQIPDIDRPTEIGPLLLSPTLSLSSTTIWQDQLAFASGRTIPGQEVQISFFEVPSTTFTHVLGTKLAKLLFPSVWAADLPRLSTTSDNQGVFSFSLPTSKAVGYRVFVKAIYNDAPTPKSQTLAFLIGAITGFFLQYILPWLILLIILLILITAGIIYERKTKKGRKFANKFIEKKLKPVAIKVHLRFRRLWYSYQRSRKLGQK